MKQWENNLVITLCHSTPEFLRVIRKSDRLVTLWKLTGGNIQNDVLGALAFTGEANAIKVYGFRAR